MDLGYAHQADYLRLKILEQHGGVYADIDTLFVKPYPAEFYQQPCVIGQEVLDADPPTLCNALIMVEQGSAFIRSWRERMLDVFDGTWNRHSCIEPARISQEMTDQIMVVAPDPFFYFSYSSAGLFDLFAQNIPLPDAVCSIHMWSHLWWDEGRTDFLNFHSGQLSEEFIRVYDTTYNLIARRYLE